MVVRKIEEERAGSAPAFFRTSGIRNPENPAMIRFPIIARKIIRPR